MTITVGGVFRKTFPGKLEGDLANCLHYNLALACIGGKEKGISSYAISHKEANI